jgi:cobalt/nickel transport system permease protein
MLVFLLGGLAVALVLAAGVSRYASSQPDGLERVAEDRGLDTRERPHALADSPFADYSTTGVEDRGLSIGIAGALGVVVTFSLAAGAVGIVTIIRRRSTGTDAIAKPTAT